MQERRVAVVVEDDEDIRGLLEAVLVQSGFDVHHTGLGEIGVDLVKRNDPDLVTLDLGLPDIDGFEVARRIRRSSDAHIVMLTARTDEIDTLLGFETGADDFLTKPFSPRQLRARVEAIMRLRARSRGAPVMVGSTGAPAETADQPQPLPRTPAAIADKPARGVEPDGVLPAHSDRSVSVDGFKIPGTPAEPVPLHDILSGGRTVRTKTSLVRRLRDDDTNAATSVSKADQGNIDTHIGNLGRKLREKEKTLRWIETVPGAGYREAAARVQDRLADEVSVGPDDEVLQNPTRETADPSTDEISEITAVLVSGYLEVSFPRGTRLSAAHLRAIGERLMASGTRLLFIRSSGLVSTRSSAQEWELPANTRVAYVGVGAADRLLVHFFNRFDSKVAEWAYFEDPLQARAWLTGSA